MRYKQVFLNKYEFEFIINSLQSTLSSAEQELSEKSVNDSIRKIVEGQLELRRKLLAYLKPLHEALKQESP